jgi:hypothetical protein
MSEEWVHRSRGRERGRGRGQNFRGAKDSGSSAAKGDRTSGEWRGGSSRGSKGGANFSSQRGRGDNQRARGSGRGDHSNQSNASSGPTQSNTSPAYPPKSSKPKRKNSLFINDDTSSEGGGAEEDESEEAQSTDDGNDASGTDVNSGPALAAFEKRMNEKWIQVRALCVCLLIPKILQLTFGRFACCSSSKPTENSREQLPLRTESSPTLRRRPPSRMLSNLWASVRICVPSMSVRSGSSRRLWTGVRR